MAQWTPTFTQSAVSDDCLTPPPSSKPSLSSISLWSCDPCALSPVTPHAPDRRKSTFRQLDPEERAVLTSLLHVSARYRDLESTLLTRIYAAGNSRFIAKRSIIVQWLTDVVKSYRFHRPTLHLAIRYMDWFMSVHPLDQSNWQLCASASLFIAAKSEEAGNNVPVVEDLMALCDNAYNANTLRMMELSMLSTMEWNLIIKTPVHFLLQFLDVVRKRVVPANADEVAAENGLRASVRGVNAGLRSTQQDVEDGMELVGAKDGSTVSETEDDDDDSDTDYMIEDCDDEDASICSDDEYAGSLECNEDLSIDSERSSAFLEFAPRVGVVGDLEHVSMTCLDLCLYDLGLSARFTPNVLAAAALAVAAETTGEVCLGRHDVCIATDLRESDIADCCILLRGRLDGRGMHA